MNDETLKHHLIQRYRPWMGDGFALTGDGGGDPEGTAPDQQTSGPLYLVRHGRTRFDPWASDCWLVVAEDEPLWSNSAPLLSIGFQLRDEVDLVISRLTATRGPMIQVDLRTPASIDDLADGVNLYHRTTRIGASPAAFPDALRAEVDRGWREMQRSTAQMVVARVHGALAGTGRISGGAVPVIDRVATLPEWRRRGVATAVIGDLLRHGLAGAPVCAAFVPTNSEVARIVARLGFRRIHGLRAYCRSAGGAAAAEARPLTTMVG